MEIVRKEYSFKSATGLCDIYARSWAPADKDSVKAIFQITHGMAEHGERYARFAKKLCEHGYAVLRRIISVTASPSRPAMTSAISARRTAGEILSSTAARLPISPARSIGKPVVFFGHSMGSFIARNYTAKYNDVQAAIFCGTSGKNPAAPIAIKLASFAGKSRGSRHKSEFINNLAFGNYNKKFDNVKTDFDWLTRDEAEVQKYIDDKYCGFLFTAAGYKDLFSVLNSVSGKDWYEQLSTDIPVLVVSVQWIPSAIIQGRDSGRRGSQGYRPRCYPQAL